MDTLPTLAAERAANAPDRVEASRRQREAAKGKLKSDVKLTTAFARRVALVTDETAAALVADVRDRLNLARYVEEIAPALAKAPIKIKDVRSATALASALNQGYEDFTPLFLEQLDAQFEAALKSSDAARRRVLMRFIAELYLVGIITEPQTVVRSVRSLARFVAASATPGVGAGGALPSNAPGLPDPEPLSNDALTNMGAFVQLMKGCGRDLLGVVHASPPSAADAPADHADAGPASAPLSLDLALPEPFRTRCVQIVQWYYRCAALRLQLETKAVVKAKRQLSRDAQRRGDVTDAAADALAARERAIADLRSDCNALALALGEEPPPPAVDDDAELNERSRAATLALWSRRRDESLSPEAWVFGDEEARAFYQDLVDLSETLPRSVLERDGRACLQPRVLERLAAAAALEAAAAAGAASAVAAASSSSDGVPTTAMEEEDAEEDLVSGLAAPDAPLVGGASAATSPEDAAAAAAGAAAATTSTTAPDEPPPKLTAVARPMEELLARLPELRSARAVDEFAQDFCHLNTKAARRRIAEELSFLRFAQADLAPFWARLVAQLGTVYVNIASVVTHAVERSLHGYLRDKRVGRVAGRLTCTKYLSELVKFGLARPEAAAPPIVAFRVVRHALDGLSGDNVETLCTFLESCGRELYRTPHTHEEVAGLLEALHRTRTTRRFSPASEAMIENAYFHCIPPEGGAGGASARRRVRVRTEVEEYVRYLLLERLGGDALSAVPPAKQVVDASASLLRLPWTTQYAECVEAVARTAVAACKRRAHGIPLVCQVLRSLANVHPNAAQRAVEDVFECIDLGLERNDFRHNQRRLGHAMFVGAALRYALISAGAFFACLHGVLNRGHRKASDVGAPPAAGSAAWGFGAEDAAAFHPDVPCAQDPPWDGFRIRLVCAALDAGGDSAVQPSERAMLYEVAAALDRYAWCKTYLPVDVECLLLDTFALVSRRSLAQCKRRNAPARTAVTLRRAGSKADAERAWADSVAVRERKRRAPTRSASSSSSSSSSRARGGAGGKSAVFGLGSLPAVAEVDGDVGEGGDEEEVGSDGDGGGGGGDSDDGGGGEGEDGGVQGEAAKGGGAAADDGATDAGPPQASAEDLAFEAEFAKLMKESIEGSGRAALSGAALGGDNLVVPLGVMRGRQGGGGASLEDGSGAPAGVALNLLKRGAKGKVEVRSLVVPEDTDLVRAATRVDANAVRRDQQSVKRLVLKAVETMEKAKVMEL